MRPIRAISLARRPLIWAAAAMWFAAVPAFADGGDSPEAVFLAVQAAAGQRDAVTIVSYLPPSCRCELLFSSIDLVGKMIAGSAHVGTVAARWRSIGKGCV